MELTKLNMISFLPRRLISRHNRTFPRCPFNRIIGLVNHLRLVFVAFLTRMDAATGTLATSNLFGGTNVLIVIKCRTRFIQGWPLFSIFNFLSILIHLVQKVKLEISLFFSETSVLFYLTDQCF